ncbi:MAG: adenylyltransferase/cytidyltransferase family protein [Lutisporaceae bacterium]
MVDKVKDYVTSNYITSDIIDDFTTLCNYVENQKLLGKKIALCHGCFDPLHFGHIMHFEEASKIADIVIVTITADCFIKKGVNRPYFNHYKRKYMICSIKYINMSSINLWDNAVETIRRLKPDYFVKGVEYKNSSHKGFLLEKNEVEQMGGKVIYTETEKYSSTTLIEKGYFKII